MLPTALLVAWSHSQPDCAVLQQANVVAGTPGLDNHGSTKYVKFLGTFTSLTECRDACTSNSSAKDPCHSWAFYYPDTPQISFAGACYGRHDNIWAPKQNISLFHNHVCTAKSCNYPPHPPRPGPGPGPGPSPLPPVSPLPQRPLAPVNPELLPIMYLGGVDHNGQSKSNYSLACKVQVVAIINSYCWSARGDPEHVKCTNHTTEFEYILEQSKALQRECPSVLTQMYLNSLMNFWWYSSIYAHFDPSQPGGNDSLLLHDVDGSLVRVTQDGGNPNMTVYDWGQNKTRSIFLSYVDRAIDAGITSFFLDKANVMTTASNEICNHICGQLSHEKAVAWDVGHRTILRTIASRNGATGPTIGNGGGGVLNLMGGASVRFRATKDGIEALKAAQKENKTSTIGASGFPFTTAGYAAFLVAYEQGRSFMWTYKRDINDIWIKEFNRVLGAPLGPPATINNDTMIYTRQFAHGIVKFDTKTNKGDFTWK